MPSGVLQICNILIRQAKLFLSGEAIFRLIEEEQSRKAIDMLKGALQVMGRFKTVYFSYKARASSECPSNPWRAQNNALFARLDAFLERCHDALDLTQTIVQFQKLAKLEVGGTKGKILSSSVAQIHTDFTLAVEAVRSCDHDIMDIEAEGFEQSYFEFRCGSKVMHHERRLASVLNQGFDDCPTVRGRLRLLDCFADLVLRPHIADELEKKHAILMQDFADGLASVVQIFLKNKDDPPIGHNLPPVAGSLAWSRGLLERVALPMQKITGFDKKVFGYA
ncbi:unnamed protein product [Discosporangium mesarthrocarpum]